MNEFVISNEIQLFAFLKGFCKWKLHGPLANTRTRTKGRGERAEQEMKERKIEREGPFLVLLEWARSTLMF